MGARRSRQDLPRNPRIRQYAREMRAGGTLAERKLWYFLRDRRLNGAKFRRQHRIGGFVADFYCPTARLVIEADGGGHGEPLQAAHDEWRNRLLTELGVRIVRFGDGDILRRTAEVLEAIRQALLAHAVDAGVSGDTPSP